MAGVKAVKTYRSKEMEIADDLVAVEEPLEIRIGYGAEGERHQKSVSVTMRTPGTDEELALGFLYTEGVITSVHDVVSIKPCFDGKDQLNEYVIRAELAPDVNVDLDRLSRNFYTSSSCGVCGKASIEAVQFQSSRKLHDYLKTVTLEEIQLMPALLQGEQTNFRHTGGIHAVGLFTREGRLLMAREDVGRHNAMDKMIGAALLNSQINTSSCMVLVSGRASFELVQKAVVAEIPVMAAVGAPSSLAIELAEEYGMTLIGFLREDRYNVYAHPSRIAQ